MPFIPNLEQVRTRTRGYLPNWERSNSIYFVTFRLADSLPLHVARALEQERSRLQHAISGGSSVERSQAREAFSIEFERALDAGYGEALLADPRIAKLIAETLTHFDGDRYRLIAWCVMPNHVHVVVRTDELSKVVHSWKSFTAHKANEILGRSGGFWYREYFDRLVRTDEELERIVAYVMGNPEKAGLRDWPWRWRAAESAAARPAGGQRYP